MTDELTDAQSHQVDVIHNAAYTAVASILEPLDIKVEWDMQWIGEVCDDLANRIMQFFNVPEAFIYPFIGAQDNDVDGNYNETTPYFWDCNCENHYIHSKTVDHCVVCGARRDDAGQPDAFVGEVIKMLARGE